MSKPVIEVSSLSISYAVATKLRPAVRGLSLSVADGEVLGLVGESGSGKTTVGYALLGHLGAAGRVVGGSIAFRGIDLLRLGRRDWMAVRGRRIGMIFQDPQSALNPALTVGEQIAESLRFHHSLARAAARAKAMEWLGRVYLPDPTAIYDRFPHQLSGGQQQRVVIAMAFAPGPELVVMDEPTTGLDVTSEARILDLVRELRAETGIAIIYISHDLRVVASICDRVAILHRGRAVEEGNAGSIMAAPLHPYTQRLIAAIPSLHAVKAFDAVRPPAAGDTPTGCSFRDRCPDAAEPCVGDRGATMLEAQRGHRVRCWKYQQVRPVQTAEAALAALPEPHATLLVIDGLTKHYGDFVAVGGVSMAVGRGEAVALIGESGSGKTTIARCVLGLITPTGGRLAFDGATLPAAIGARAPSLRQRLQIVFQNPDGSLNGRRTIGETLVRPLLLHGFAADHRQARDQAAALLEEVELSAGYLERYPHELSGGEKQRTAIARAFACRPDLVVCDEPVASLDVSVQATVLALFRRLQREHSAAYLFITHDLGVVRQVAHRAVVLYRGVVCQQGPVDSLFSAGRHPYVGELLASLPHGTGRDQSVGFATPPVSSTAPPPIPGGGCAYVGRCTAAVPGLCDRLPPPAQSGPNGALVMCHRSADQLAPTFSAA